MYGSEGKLRIPKFAKIVLGSTLFRVGQVRTILAGPCRGLKYRVFPDMGLSPLYGGWEADAQALMVKHIAADSVGKGCCWTTGRIDAEPLELAQGILACVSGAMPAPEVASQLAPPE